MFGVRRRSFGRKQRKSVFSKGTGLARLSLLQSSLKHHAHLLKPLNPSAKLAPAWARWPVQTYNKELRRLIQRSSVVAQLSHHRRTPPLSARAGSADGLMFLNVGWISQRFFAAHHQRTSRACSDGAVTLAHRREIAVPRSALGPFTLTSTEPANGISNFA